MSARGRWRLAALGLFLAVGLVAPVPANHDYCKTWSRLGAVEKTGTVGEFAPALNAFAFGLPADAPGEVRLTAKTMAESWNALYTNYLRNGGDPRVRLQVDGQVPGGIGGVTAEWRDSLDRAAGREVYDYAARRCGPA